jgi:hypothetical protein
VLSRKILQVEGNTFYADARRESSAARQSKNAHAGLQHVEPVQESISSIPDAVAETATELPEAVVVQTPEPGQAAESAEVAEEHIDQLA